MKRGWFSIHLFLTGLPVSLQQRFKKPLVSAVPFIGPRLMSPEAAASYIAVSIDVMYEMIHAGKIPFVPKGNGKRRLYTIDRCDLDAWIEANKTREAA
jgi:excisionase family DNA binding protein